MRQGLKLAMIWLCPRDAQRDVDLGRSASRASFIALMCSSMRGIAMHIPSEPDVTEGGCCKQTRTLRPLDPCRGREPLLKKLLFFYVPPSLTHCHSSPNPGSAD